MTRPLFSWWTPCLKLFIGSLSGMAVTISGWYSLLEIPNKEWLDGPSHDFSNESIIEPTTHLIYLNISTKSQQKKSFGIGIWRNAIASDCCGHGLSERLSLPHVPFFQSAPWTCPILLTIRLANLFFWGWIAGCVPAKISQEDSHVWTNHQSWISCRNP